MSAAWERMPDLPEANGGLAVLPHGDGLRVLGGTNWRNGQKVWLDVIWDWQPGQPAWRTVGRLPSPMGYGASVVRGQSVVLFGGQDSGGAVRSIFEISPSATVRVMGTSEENWQFASAVPLRKNWFVIARNGVPEGEPARGGCFLYEAEASKFRRLPDLPNQAWLSPGAASSGDRVLIVGGASKGAGASEAQNRNDIYRFDASTASWTRHAILPVAGRGIAAKALNDEVVYCAGGYVDAPSGEGGHFSTRGFLVSMTSGRVRESIPVPIAAMGHFAINGPNIYFLGGEDIARHRSAAVFRIKIADVLASARQDTSK